MPNNLVGIREARLRLGKMLKAVQEGVEWVITDRGRPIAKLVPIAREDLKLEERIKRLEEAGWVTPPPKSAKPLPPPLPVQDGIAQQMLQDDRDR